MKTNYKNKLRKSNPKLPCYYCKRVMVPANGIDAKINPGLVATVEHKRPQGEGGTHEAENLELACLRCNNLRGNIPFSVFNIFARNVIKQYPNTPTKILRICLNSFLYGLAESSLSNRQNVRKATSAALLTIADQVY